MKAIITSTDRCDSVTSVTLAADRSLHASATFRQIDDDVDAKAFFEYRIDCDGKPVDNRHYFENLTISKDDEAMARLGAFPVISITLKDVIQHSFKEALGGLSVLRCRVLPKMG